MIVLLRNCVFVGVMLLIATQVQGIEYLEDAIAQARDNMALHKSGKDFGKPVFNTKGVALDVGKLNNETFPLLSDELKMAIATCHKVLIKASNNNSDYDAVIAKMRQSSVLEPIGEPSLKAQVRSISETTKTKVLNDWFSQLIGNPEFLSESHLNAGSSISMAKATMLIFKNLKNSCGDKSTTIESPVINLAVLLYPQPKTDLFVVNRVTLRSWVDCGGWDAGIQGQYVRRGFKPLYSIIAGVKKGTLKRAVAFIEDIFDKIAPKNESANTDIPDTTSSSSTCFLGNSSAVLMSMLAAFVIAAIIRNWQQ